jgi:hypothetical protein
MVTRFAASQRTDNSPQRKEAQPPSHSLTSDYINILTLRLTVWSGDSSQLAVSRSIYHPLSHDWSQTRGWFYTLMVLSTALFGKPAFKNLVCNGLVLAEDGKKMSKRLKNYPDPVRPGAPRPCR